MWCELTPAHIVAAPSDSRMRFSIVGVAPRNGSLLGRGSSPGDLSAPNDDVHGVGRGPSPRPEPIGAAHEST